MTPYVGEVRLVGFNFAPEGWMLCQGQQLSISGNEALFNLIGTTYGGNGQTTFNLPDLRGRSPMHWGNSSGGNWVPGQIAGTETVTLTAQQIAQHSHQIGASTGTPLGIAPTNNTFGVNSTVLQYDHTPNNISAPLLAPAGPAQPHDNLMPYAVMNYIISLFGIYPTRS